MKLFTKTFAAILLAALVAVPVSRAATIQFSGVPVPDAGLVSAVTLNAVANPYTNLADAVVAPIAIPQNTPLSFSAVFAGSSALVTTNVIGVGWALTTDGTNYCNATNQFFWQLIYPRGTTTVYSQSNAPAWLFTGARYMKPVQVTNNTFATTNMTGTLSQLWVGKP